MSERYNARTVPPEIVQSGWFRDELLRIQRALAVAAYLDGENIFTASPIVFAGPYAQAKFTDGANVLELGWSGNVFFFKQTQATARQIRFRDASNYDLLVIDPATGNVVVKSAASTPIVSNADLTAATRGIFEARRQNNVKWFLALDGSDGFAVLDSAQNIRLLLSLAAESAGKFLRSDGGKFVASTIQAGDVSSAGLAELAAQNVFTDDNQINGSLTVGEDLFLVGAATLLGGTRVAIRTLTATTSLTVNDCVVLGDASGGAFTLHLPGLNQGALITIKNIGGANNITVDTPGSELIDGAASITVTPGQVARLVTDINNWFQI